jgi:TRAP-type transport system small permease protein
VQSPRPIDASSPETPAAPGRVSLAFEEGLATACMALLVLITLVNVLTRYLTNEGLAWTEEISVFLLVVMALAGTSAAAARDRHIRIELFYEGGSALRQRSMKVFAAGVTGVFFLVLVLFFARVVADERHYNETSMGLGVPRWWYTVFSPLLCAAVALRALAAAWHAARGS